MNNYDKWLMYYELACNYYNHYGNLFIPKSFKTLDGINISDDENSFDLGNWLKNQKVRYRKKILEIDRVRKLEKLNIIWEGTKNDVIWEFNYYLAKKYFYHYNNLDIPKSFKTLDGINESSSENAVDLGLWLNKQKKNYNNLSLERINLLNDLNIAWSKNKKNWDNNYNLLCIYYDYYKNIDISSHFKTIDGINISDDENAVNLGSWLKRQRIKYKEGTLSDKKIEKLEKVKISWDYDLDEKRWEQKFILAKKYFDYYKNLDIPSDFKTIDGINNSDDKDAVNLGNWIVQQRYKYKRDRLSIDKKQKLDKLNINWQIKKILPWNECYQLAKNYYNHYGDLKIPINFNTIDGINRLKENEGYNLGNWLHYNRVLYKNNQLSQERINLLNELEIIWSFDLKKEYEDLWNKNYKLAKNYYNHYHNLHILSDFKTLDGINSSNDKDAVSLGKWIVIQRKNKKNNQLSQEKIDLLNEIGMIWFVDLKKEYKDLWNKTYSLAEKYYNHYGNLNIKRSFKTVDGINSSNDKDAVSLGKWIATQREYYKLGSLSKDKIDLLNKIEMIWSFDLKKEYEDLWNKTYNLVKNYYNYYGDLNIPIDFKTVDGINNSDDKDAVNLGNWFSTQRRKKKLNELSKERIDLLNDLNISWTCSSYNSWDENYKLLCNYYNHYKNLDIPFKFKTVNGINQSNNDAGIYLDDWVRNQRTRYKKKELTKKQIELLSNINFVFMRNETKQYNILKLLRVNYISINMNDYNSLIIDRITYHEFYVKLLFLKENKINILDNQGNLNNIFNMSNEYLEKIYNVSLEQLLNKYFYFNKKKK